jgi:phage terminase large subunit-like protein
VIGLDLSRGGYGAQLDLTTMCLMVVDGDKIRGRNVSWWAGTDIGLDEKRCKNPLGAWVEQGLLRRMPGEWHDMMVVEAEIEALMMRYDIRKIGVDPHPSQARDIKRWMDRGWPIVPVDQSIRTMAPAWKLWGDLLKSRQLFYEPDPVLSAALNAVRLVKDNVGNIRPVKGRSAGNTDAVVAGNIAFPQNTHHAALSPRCDCQPVVVAANVHGREPADLAGNRRTVFVVHFAEVCRPCDRHL